MNSLSNKYCVLKRSFSCALQKKSIPIPYFVKNDLQIYYNATCDASGILTVLEESKICSKINTNKDTALKKSVVTTLSASSSRRPYDKVSCYAGMALCTRLPFKYAKLKICSSQSNPLAKTDELNCSCCSTNTNTKRDCITVRPLLDFSRNLITAVCQYAKLPVYPDRSNQSLYYSRNRIRKQIIPGIQLFFNPQAEDVLFQFAELVLQEQRLVSRLIHTIRR